MDALRPSIRHLIIVALIALTALVLPHRRHHHHRHAIRALTQRCAATTATPSVVEQRHPSPPSEIERIYRRDRAAERGTYDAYRRPR